MTTPMHTIVWLGLGEWTLAQAEFNRSMHAACYGSFNVRNEVCSQGFKRLYESPSEPRHLARAPSTAPGRQACGHPRGPL